MKRRRIHTVWILESVEQVTAGASGAIRNLCHKNMVSKAPNGRGEKEEEEGLTALGFVPVPHRRVFHSEFPSSIEAPVK